MFPVLYSPNEPEHFLGFFTSRIRIQEAYLFADPCGSGSETLEYTESSMTSQSSPLTHLENVLLLVRILVLEGVYGVLGIPVRGQQLTGLCAKTFKILCTKRGWNSAPKNILVLRILI